MTSVTPTPSILATKSVQIRTDTSTDPIMTETGLSETLKARGPVSPAQEDQSPSLHQLMGKAMDILTMMQADRAQSGDVTEPAFETPDTVAEMNELFEALGIRGDDRTTRADLEAARQELPPVDDSAAEILRLLGGKDGAGA